MVQMCSLKTSVDKQQERELTNTQSVKNSCGKRKVWHCPGVGTGETSHLENETFLRVFVENQTMLCIVFRNGLIWLDESG